MTKYFVPIQLSILLQWQSKVIDLVDPYLPSFLYSLYIYIYIIELFLVLNIAEILLTGR
jgi:hypothetical protein